MPETPTGKLVRDDLHRTLVNHRTPVGHIPTHVADAICDALLSKLRTGDWTRQVIDAVVTNALDTESAIQEDAYGNSGGRTGYRWTAHPRDIDRVTEAVILCGDDGCRTLGSHDQ